MPQPALINFNCNHQTLILRGCPQKSLLVCGGQQRLVTESVSSYLPVGSVYGPENPEKLLSSDNVVNIVGELNSDVDTRTVDTRVSRLRKMLQLDGSKGRKLAPIDGCGYRFEAVG